MNSMKHAIFVSILLLGIIAIAQCRPKNRRKSERVAVDPRDVPRFTNATMAVGMEEQSWGDWFRDFIGEENIQTAFDAKQKVLNKADEIIQSGKSFIGEENLQAARDAKQNVIDKAGEIIQSGRDYIGEERINAAAAKTSEFKNKVAEVIGNMKQKVVESVRLYSSDGEPIEPGNTPVVDEP